MDGGSGARQVLFVWAANSQDAYSWAGPTNKVDGVGHPKRTGVRSRT